LHVGVLNGLRIGMGKGSTGVVYLQLHLFLNCFQPIAFCLALLFGGRWKAKPMKKENKAAHIYLSVVSAA
jgi:hypothetical protein